ncbi:MAG: hypothetical protein WC692_08950 [Erythrobacter sp.]|jgi:hypothetical protein
MEGGVDFGPLLARPAFRSDLLYFIRLAGNYAASIFADVRNRAPTKHRRAFDDWLASHQCNDAMLKTELTDHRKWFDAHKRDFTNILEDMPHYMRDRLTRALQYDHALTLDHRGLSKCLDDLREYRHWLEHAEERIDKGEKRPQNVTDDRLLHILGLMLLPFMGNHLLGRIRHHAGRSGLRAHDVQNIAAPAKAILDSALTDRREASKFINGLKRRVDNDTIRRRITTRYGNAPSDQAVHRIAREDAKKRRDLEDRKSALLDLHRRYFAEGHWPRYNYENFLIRFGFIGRARIAAMENLLRNRSDEPLDFILHIEPLFMLSMDIALIIHCWLAALEERGVPIRNMKQIGPRVPAIRNAISHGGWVWDVIPKGENAPLPFGEVLTALLTALDHSAVNDKARWKNDLLTAIEGALRPMQWSRVHDRSPPPADDPNRMPPGFTVKRWDAATRTRFADRTRWHIEKRQPLRRIAAAWMRELAKVRSETI